MDQYYNDLFDNDRIDLKTASFDWQTKAVAIDNTLLKPRGYDHIAGTNCFRNENRGRFPP
jgi:hypothetical protein